MNYDIGYPHDIKITRKALPSKEAYYTLLLEVDTKQSKFFGQEMENWGHYGKRKVENLIIIKNSGERTKVIYR